MACENIFGDTDQFAISVSNRVGDGPTREAECNVWLQGMPVGDVGQKIFVESFRRGLQGLANSSHHTGDTPRMPNSPQDFLSMIEDGEIRDAGQHQFLAIAGFDDFLKLFFKNNRCTRFILSIHPNLLSSPLYLTKYGDKVFSIEIDNSIINSVISEFFSAEI